MMSLGRIKNHDPRSLAFPASTTGTHRPVTHRTYGSVLDQGDVGSCVGNTSAHALNTRGMRKVPSRLVNEAQAVEIYAAATAIDQFPGTYPDQDTGTDINSAAKVLRDQGRITSWTHAFGLDQTLAALQLAPVALGTNWHDSMFEPDSKGFVHPDGSIVGGHEVLIRADDARGSVLVRNSWSASWGLRGHFRLTYADLAALLADSGDACVFVRTDTIT